MIRIAIIIGSVRPNRKGEAVGNWFYEQARLRTDANFELIDLLDRKLPLLNEPLQPSEGKYTHQHTKDWSTIVSQFDAFVFVTPEYNHSMPASLKNAIDYLYKEWNHKAAGFVSYGSAGGVRAVEQLRQVMAEIKIADVQPQVVLSTAHDFENRTTFKPREQHLKSIERLLNDLILWGEAMKIVREKMVLQVK